MAGKMKIDGCIEFPIKNELIGPTGFTVMFRFNVDESEYYSFDQYGEHRYKTYYSWEIVSDCELTEKLSTTFKMICDENSVIVDLPRIIRHVIKQKEDVEMLRGMGQATSVWDLKYTKRYNGRISILFYVFNDLTNSGYRFQLSKKEAERFAAFLDEVNDRMKKRTEVVECES